MFITKAKRVSVSSEDVWISVGENFGKISSWAAGVTTSHMKKPDADLNGNTRVCEVPGMGTLVEEIDLVDHDRRKLGYLINGMPSIVARCYNTMEIRHLSTSQSEVVITWDVTTKGVMGKIMQPMMKMQLSGATEKLLEEMKTFLETGKPHARKVKAISKQKKAA